MITKNKLLFALNVVGLIIIGLVSFVSMKATNRHASCSQGFDYINSDAACSGNPAVLSKGSYIILQNEINRYIQSEQQAGRLSEAAVYFRDLRNGPVFGVNPDAKFIPASLLKVPLALFLLDVAEERPDFLTKKLQFNDRTEQRNIVNTSPSPLDVNQSIMSHEEIIRGNYYTVEELLFRMLAYSDNASYAVLLTEVYDHLGGEPMLRERYRELGIVDPTYSDDTITVRGYASLFRQLYHVSYLNPELSEKMLNWLSQSDFNSGLVDGVPQGIRVAHKFGERELENGVVQIHDCGIVYYIGNPYLACVMTRGKDIQNLTTIISTLSKMIYTEVDLHRIAK